jgi:hypothetical protein
MISEKTIGEERRCPPEAIGVVDLLQVLEGAAYVGFIAGAIFAVIELRTLTKDRKTELLMRVTEFSGTLEFETAGAKFMRASFRTPEEAEEQCSLPVLMMIADFNENLGILAQRGLVSKDVVLDTFNFEYVWDKIKVWARPPLSEPARPNVDNYRPSYPAFEWLAGEYKKKRLAAEQKAKGV